MSTETSTNEDELLWIGIFLEKLLLQKLFMIRFCAILFVDRSVYKNKIQVFVSLLIIFLTY